MGNLLSQTEENYLKAVYKIAGRVEGGVANTNAIAGELTTTAASVTDMLRRLGDKNLVFYEKYKGASLTESGSLLAKGLLRRHRLWETFLAEKLGYGWDEVHDMAEQLEHVEVADLTDRLDAYLGRPQFDPHGDPIPDALGNLTADGRGALSSLSEGEEGVIVGVEEDGALFLRHLESQGLLLGALVKVVSHYKYDQSMRILVGGEREGLVSEKIGKQVFVKRTIAKPEPIMNI